MDDGRRWMDKFPLRACLVSNLSGQWFQCLLIGWWAGMLLSKYILLKYRTNDDRYSSAGVDCALVYLTHLQCRLCVLPCINNSPGPANLC